MAIETTVAGLGYQLVDTERAARGLLRITIDRIPGQRYAPQGGLALPGQPVQDSEFITVQDCEKVTRQLQYALEVEALDYARLEVSSPGLDRPLKRPQDYERFAGQAVLVVLKSPFKGRKNWQGVLTAVAANPDQVANAAENAAGGVPPAGFSEVISEEILKVPSGQAAAAAPAWSLVLQDGKNEQVLAFTLDEVREARLVPVVNFKGRKAGDSGSEQAAAADPTQVGG